jgi:hypothetical protein
MHLSIGVDLGALHRQKAKLSKSRDTGKRKSTVVMAEMGDF